MARGFSTLDAVLTACVVAAAAFVGVVRWNDAACEARRVPAQAMLTRIAVAERGVLKEQHRYDDMPLCTPGASPACAGKVVTVVLPGAPGYSFYARARQGGFVAVAVGTSGPALGDVLTLDANGATTSSPGVCGRW